jgi:hypothetical protein
MGLVMSDWIFLHNMADTFRFKPGLPLLAMTCGSPLFLMKMEEDTHAGFSGLVKV